jgi:hypothetical protein
VLAADVTCPRSRSAPTLAFVHTSDARRGGPCEWAYVNRGRGRKGKERVCYVYGTSQTSPSSVWARWYPRQSRSLSLACPPQPYPHSPCTLKTRARVCDLRVCHPSLERGRAAVSRASQMKSTKTDAHTSQIHIFFDIRPSPLLILSCSAVRSVLPTSSQLSVSCLPLLWGTVRRRCRER